MSTTSPKHEDSDEEFESADEGEPITPPIAKPPTPPSSPPSDPIPPAPIETPVQSIPPPPPPPPAVTDGWGDWNFDDDQVIETAIEIPNPSQIDSVSSRSSTPSKTSGSLSHIGSDEDDPTDSSNQQRLQRKKYRKKSLESNLNKEENKITTRISRPTGRGDEETSSLTTTTTKHDAKDAHNVLDRLAAQSPTRQVN
jgi:hypothetical protein